MDEQQLLLDLRSSVDRLADAVSDEPRIAGALRRFAAGLPTTGPSLRHTVADGRPFVRGFESGLDTAGLTRKRPRVRAAVTSAPDASRYSPPVGGSSAASSGASSSSSPGSSAGIG